ncbi:hypothetical protein [Geosporobacter ferrireducens]|uniref:Uncharacterized protein n=1 Tax=Geosporobacter ferrireducens TaxID=1424294 RepID=A0A1D8GIS4_9FIRM|nr:hypothetical protein [Geosporobacter ferrireducens]AOT70806.1 hypothetical protein Gferi_15325 [Geosporobacter ferrireducens]MTI53503.1 hypothetical protein [Geosporobacter ferrireducens]
MSMVQMKYENAVNPTNTEVILKEEKQKSNTCVAGQESQTQANNPMNGFSVNYWGAGSKTDELCWDLCWDD